VGLEWSEDPESYAGGSLVLVGSPLPDRSKVMAQTKRGTLVLQVGVWVAG
jgi:predicted 2-oxoglutarate/Fe(II)-dependent dioxygenase YbiX